MIGTLEPAGDLSWHMYKLETWMHFIDKIKYLLLQFRQQLKGTAHHAWLWHFHMYQKARGLLRNLHAHFQSHC